MRILITSGPTRQYLDPVRYISNASSGRMGAALAEAVLRAGHEAVVVSGPVEIRYPDAAQVIPIQTTEEMLDAAMEQFPQCDGVIGAAAPCDYRPVRVATHKLSKTGESLRLHLVETPDVMAALGKLKPRDNGKARWLVAFALETSDFHLKAMQKMERKCADLIVVNGPAAIESDTTSVEIMDRKGRVIADLSGTKANVASGIVDAIQNSLV